MKITKRQLRRIMREAIHGEPAKSFRIAYRSSGYRGRQIVSRDRAWLEFVPKGAPSMTPPDMFRSVTLLEPGDPEISKALQRGAPKSMGSLDRYDVYYVYATTTG